MTIEQQIESLNSEVKCTIAPSTVQGIGVFALRDIKKGEKLYCTTYERMWCTVPFERLEELRPEIREIVLARWPQIIHGKPFLSPNNDQLLSSFLNHSDTPNYDPFIDKATRDIAKGEEILEDYRMLGDRAPEVYPFLKK